jgi:hypothetical protein
MFETAFLALFVLLIRQQVVGKPSVTITSTGLVIGDSTIPWMEVDEVGGASLNAL